MISLDLVFFDTTSIYFEGEGGEILGQKGHSKDHRPEVFNDRGRQMKAKPIQTMLEDMKMPQRIAWHRTPNDNRFIEASFITAKRDPEYPGRFRDLEEGYEYFNPYLTWYNQEHYHSGINYVTPDQAHRGLMDRIVAQPMKNIQRNCLDK